jgi:hypothetical protein
MPWCDDCSKFWNPTSMREDGSCPSCQRVLVEPEEPPKAPWHFKLMVAAVSGYLLWRVVQLVGWVVT